MNLMQYNKAIVATIGALVTIASYWGLHVHYDENMVGAIVNTVLPILSALAVHLVPNKK